MYEESETRTIADIADIADMSASYQLTTTGRETNNRFTHRKARRRNYLC